VDWCGVEPFTEGPLTDGWGDAVGRVAFAAPWLIGAERLVERLRMSLPCTTMLSLDFLRSRVSISVTASVRVDTVCDSWRTVTAGVQVDDRAYADIDNSEEALVLLLELLLVEDLHREDALFVDLPALLSAWSGVYSVEYDVHVEALVPVGVQRLLDDARGARLLAIDRGHGEGIGEACIACISGMSPDLSEGAPTEDIALIETIGRDNCTVSVPLSSSQQRKLR
jgi:hypothetical protein